MADQRWADLVNARFEGGYPTAQAAAALRDEIRFQRGVQLDVPPAFRTPEFALFHAVVGWSVADHMREELVIDAFRMAVANRRPGTGEVVFHSDRGSHWPRVP